ncbi:hypothetical protein CAEBREN_07604 [Caenorhabditis brenneri]|uniref:C-type lectin domain-containing protein n=1 Tax=Caenorhabditis brenneri TaxID=135651 RepID=G0N6H3_CAEBE|nr:hypothetical protein CAEBREN_07604 [Caenorhabditis brenneri]
MYTLVLLFTLFQNALGQCVLGDDAYVGGLCYTASTYKATYSEAEFTCNGKAQSLAIIRNTAQANVLATLVNKITKEPNGLFWIGLKRKTMGSRWQWEDGTPFSWSNFDSNYLQNNLYVAESTMNGKWRTLDGEESHYFVCSYDPNLVNPTTSQSETTYYPSGSTDYPYETTPYPYTDSTYYPGETTSYVYPDGTTSYEDPGTTSYVFETTSYEDPGTTSYADPGTTSYEDPGTTSYVYETTDYPDYDSTVPDVDDSTPNPFDSTTDFPRLKKQLNKLPEGIKQLLRKYNF